MNDKRTSIQEMVELFNNRKVNKKMIENAAKSLVGLYEYLILLAEYVDNCEKTIKEAYTLFLSLINLVIFIYLILLFLNN